MLDISNLLKSDCPFRVLYSLMNEENDDEPISVSTIPTNVSEATDKRDNMGTGNRRS